MNFKRFESREKLYGIYETPYEVALLLARYAVGAGGTSICEFGTGRGIFIDALRGATTNAPRALHYFGIERDQDSAQTAQARLAGPHFAETSQVRCADAFTVLAKTAQSFDAAIGNPPYIRYQYLEKQQQDSAEHLFRSLDVPFTRHTNAWTTLLIAAFSWLRPGGRLAVIIPTEILHVLHARGVRNYLLASCERITVVDIEDMVFDALQGATLLLAQKKRQEGPTSATLHLARYRNLAELPQTPDQLIAKARPASRSVDLSYKWMTGLLTEAEADALDALQARGTVRKFDEVASIDVGIVTGANKFFLVTAEIADKFGLWDFVVPAFGRSEHILGVVFDRTDHERNSEMGLPSYMLVLPSEIPRSKLPTGVRRYLTVGEAQQLPSRYKCRIRDPWWSVPSVYASPVGMLKRSHDIPRMLVNRAGAMSTDTAYRVRVSGSSPSSFVASFVNSVTALSAEMNGRHYGGGVLELVPSEAERLLVPSSPRAADVSKLDRAVRLGISAAQLLREQDLAIYSAEDLHYVDRLHAAWCRLRLRRQRSSPNEDALLPEVMPS